VQTVHENRHFLNHAILLIPFTCLETANGSKNMAGHNND